jgi:hypothetical protein
MTEERDEDSGKFVEQYPEEEFLRVIEELDTPTTQRIADEVGCSYDLAYRRLRSLEGDSKVTQTEIGGSFLWSLG